MGESGRIFGVTVIKSTVEWPRISNSQWSGPGAQWTLINAAKLANWVQTAVLQRDIKSELRFQLYLESVEQRPVYGVVFESLLGCIDPFLGFGLASRLQQQ